MNPRKPFQYLMHRAHTIAFGKTYRFDDRHQGLVKIRLVAPPATSGATSTFVFGIFKGGSTLLNRMTADILAESGSYPFELPGRLFKLGCTVENIIADLDNVFELPGMVYSGFRSVPPVLQSSANFKRSKKLLLVRDPRDILVSLYFSHAYSHEIPGSGEARKAWEDRRSRALATDIDQYAIQNAPSVLSHLMRMANLLDSDQTTLMRYEDIIFNKGKLADTICSTIGVSVSPEARVAIIKKNDIIPDKENKYAHIRNVSPGDHARKLKPETIKALDKVLAPALDVFWPEGQKSASTA